MPKKIPMRMCIVCRTMLPKQELLRLVHTDEGVVLDGTGKRAGRGAYICKNPGCMEKCVKKRIADKVFSEKLSDDTYQEILLEYEKLS